jgi:hypothetical protein
MKKRIHNKVNKYLNKYKITKYQKKVKEKEKERRIIVKINN